MTEQREKLITFKTKAQEALDSGSEAKNSYSRIERGQKKKNKKKNNNKIAFYSNFAKQKKSFNKNRVPTIQEVDGRRT